MGYHPPFSFGRSSVAAGNQLGKTAPFGLVLTDAAHQQLRKGVGHHQFGNQFGLLLRGGSAAVRTSEHGRQMLPAGRVIAGEGCARRLIGLGFRQHRAENCTGPATPEGEQVVEERHDVALKAAGVIRREKDGVRVMSDGELKAKVSFEVAGASKAAVEKIEKAGGSIKLLSAAAEPAAE